MGRVVLILGLSYRSGTTVDEEAPVDNVACRQTSSAQERQRGWQRFVVERNKGEDMRGWQRFVGGEP